MIPTSVVQRPHRDVDPWPTSSADAKSEWSYTSIHLCAFMVCTGTTVQPWHQSTVLYLNEQCEHVDQIMLDDSF